VFIFGPFRANAAGEFPRVNPGLSFLGHFGPQIESLSCPTLRRDGVI
jgi:hypothetical protein